MSLRLSDLDQSQITLFDLSSLLPRRAFSVCAWRIRYALNFKGLPFTTHWVELKDVQTLCASIGAEPTIKLPNGEVTYTIPVIYDPSTRKLISDSLNIVEYLDATYPSLPVLMPTVPLITRGFTKQAQEKLTPLYQFVIPPTFKILPEESQGYFRITREAYFKKPLEEAVPLGVERRTEWAKVKAAFDELARFFESQKGGPRKWFMGDIGPSYIDLFLAATCMWVVKVLGEDSLEWCDIKQWNGGKWGQLLESCRVYEGDY